ncbi:MAG: FHA domain-containing protein, partial [Patulibacter sp.]|nr:FHA domain-containing protein [Patulibacter sp.]
APWIDPTLQRQSRPQFAPPVIPARAQPQPAEQPPAQPQQPRQPQRVLLVDGTPHQLSGDIVVLGRSRTADVTVSDASVSRRHVELRHDDHGWYAVDLGSTNGSQVDGTPLTAPRRLEPGSRIKLGHADAIIEVR